MKKKGLSKKAIPAPAPLTVSANVGVGTVTLGNAQHQGARSYQEDSFGFSSIDPNCVMTKGLLAVLADGMGGLKNGKAVSDASVTNLLSWFNAENSVCRTGEDLRNVADAINQRICDIYCSSGKVEAGSTLVAAHVNNGYLHWLCIGDSRLYLKRKGKLYQVNEDHDYLNEMLFDVIDNTVSLQDALSNRQKDSLVGCIGNRNLKYYDYSKQGFRLQDGDVLALCTDGVYNAITPAEFNMNITSDAMTSCMNIIQLIAGKRHPNQDNNTIVIISYKE